MVYFYTTEHDGITYDIYMGKDKFENELLIKHGLASDIWFHVDDHSSAHIYLRLPPTSVYSTTNLPDKLLDDCCQLTKQNSIDGSKLNNIRVVYTPWSNLKKTGDMVVGQIGFHSERQRKFKLVEEKINATVNRLNKTRSEITMDEHIARKQKIEGEVRKADKERKRKEAQEAAALKEAQAKEKSERSYDKLFDSTSMTSNAEVAYRSNQDAVDDDFM